jgi:TolB-like protein/DNA-binding winged helix-turn-helix (wHTH) protein/Tfp pilus assembly protein PilF
MAITGAGIPDILIRFADCELNASAFELRRGRRTVKLERIPLQVLLLLIEEHGRVVTREAIADHVWGKGVFLDVDNGINTAIRKIRQVLNDDPQNPQFVETIPGSGYRFIAALHTNEAPVRAVEGLQEKAPSLVVPRTAGTGVSPASGELQPRRRSNPRTAGMLIALLLVAGIGGWLTWRHFIGQRHIIGSIAVLPFQNLSGDSSQDYFADGMTEEIITELSRIESLRVISHTSVMDYKGTKKHLPEIARELGVDAILEGSVIRENNNVRVTVQLLDGPADRHLWGEEYERPLNGVLNLQRDVGQAIGEKVRAKLSATQQVRLRKAHAVNPAAYDAYLRGRFYFDTGFGNPDSLKKGKQYFEESIQADPKFAQAYAGLANSYVYSAYAGALKRDEAYHSAKDALTKAMELDDSVGEAHYALGLLKSDFEWDWEAADREFNRAIALAPSYSCAHESRALFLASLGRRDEALDEIAKIDQLDFSLGTAGTTSWVYYSLRDYPNLIDASKRALLLDPNNSGEHYLLGVGYEQTGKLQEAISEYQKAVEASGNSDNVVALAHAYSAAGRKAEAEKMLRDLESKVNGTAGSSLTMARIFAGLGDKDKAFEFLEKAYSEKSFGLPTSLKADLLLDNLRSDPRYQSLLGRMGLNN